MRLLIAGGGTGGHIFPGLAVARSLRARPDAPDLAWVGGHRGQEARIVPDAGIPLHRLVLRSLRSTGRDAHVVGDPVRLALSVPQAGALLARLRPAAVFTTGGYVALPIAVAAVPLGIPIVLWEGNVIPGRSVRAIARLVAIRTVSFEPTCRALAGGAPCYVTGTPIRDPSAIDRDEARRRLDVGTGIPVVLVFGGSQAVRRLNVAVEGALPELARRCTVIHVTGDDGYAGALAAREALPDDLRARYRPKPFLRDEMADALVVADLVVGRAGSSTVAEVTAVGVPMVVVPYPHAAGHQRANARILVDAGAALLIEDESFDGPALLAAAGAILDDPSRRRAMADASRALGRPAAADAVADLVLAAASRRPLPGPAEVDRRSRGVAA
jgi:UDP-N-acetylglucosamine--N-acetylmuramyl-(pentapeptide) pyrophosphoryl-undecaprenol N-acetylglucosamine transferase